MNNNNNNNNNNKSIIFPSSIFGNLIAISSSLLNNQLFDATITKYIEDKLSTSIRSFIVELITKYTNDIDNNSNNSTNSNDYSIIIDALSSSWRIYENYIKYIVSIFHNYNKTLSEKKYSAKSSIS